MPLLAGGGEASALFLGAEEPQRRFRYNDEYFMHVLSYRLPQDWAPRRARARAGFQGTGGSTTTEDLALFEEAWLDADLSPGGDWRMDFRYLEDETYDLRFRRNEIGLDGPLGLVRGARFRLFGEAFGEKEDSDLGLGFYLGDRRSDHLGAELVAVDFAFNRKSDTGRFDDQQPRTWRLLGRKQDADWRIAGQAELDMPLDRRDASLGSRLHYRKAALDLQADRRVAGNRRLSLGLRAEQGRIHRFGLPGSSVDSLAMGRGAGRIHLELGDWQPASGGWSTGLLLHYLHEGYGRTADPARIRSERRIDAVPYLHLLRPLGVHWTLSTELYLAGVFQRARYQALPARGWTEDGLESKAGFRFRYEATEQSGLVLGAYVDLDDPRFGGGNIAFAIWF